MIMTVVPRPLQTKTEISRELTQTVPPPTLNNKKIHFKDINILLWFLLFGFNFPHRTFSHRSHQLPTAVLKVILPLRMFFTWIILCCPPRRMSVALIITLKRSLPGIIMTMTFANRRAGNHNRCFHCSKKDLLQLSQKRWSRGGMLAREDNSTPVHSSSPSSVACGATQPWLPHKLCSLGWLSLLAFTKSILPRINAAINKRVQSQVTSLFKETCHLPTHVIVCLI